MPNRLLKRTLLLAFTLLFAICPGRALANRKYLPPTLPENVVRNAIRAYVDRDADEYESCLADSFRFSRHGGTPGLFGPEIPDEWDKARPHEIATAMLRGAPAASDSLRVQIEPLESRSSENLGAQSGCAVLRFNVLMERRHGPPVRTGNTFRLVRTADPPGKWQITKWDEGPAFTEQVVWEKTVDTCGTLYWYGHPFTGAVHFLVSDLHLMINDQPVPFWESLGQREEARELNPRVLLEERARQQASSFEEWVQIFRDSDLVEELLVQDKSIRVNWAGLEVSEYVTIIYRPKEEELEAPQPAAIATRTLERAAGYLERGFDVWVHGFKMFARAPGDSTTPPNWALEDMHQPHDAR